MGLSCAIDSVISARSEEWNAKLLTFKTRAYRVYIQLAKLFLHLSPLWCFEDGKNEDVGQKTIRIWLIWYYTILISKCYSPSKARLRPTGIGSGTPSHRRYSVPQDANLVNLVLDARRGWNHAATKGSLSLIQIYLCRVPNRENGAQVLIGVLFGGKADRIRAIA